MKTPRYESVRFLIAEYDKAHQQTDDLTYRGFSKLIGLPSGRFSEYLNGKRKITVNAARKIATALKLSKEQTEYFILACENDYESLKAVEIEPRYYADLSNPLYFEFLCLLDLRNFKSDINWISEKMSLDVIEVQKIISFLKKSNMVHVTHDNQIIKVQSAFTTKQNIPSKKIQEGHVYRLDKAKKALKKYGPEKRIFRSTTFAINTKKLKQAFDLISEFKVKMCSLLEDSHTDEVYYLNVQLFPAAHTESDKNT